MADEQVLSGAPTKRFFVSMLPRDIELDDAILDLVDNSVDGAMRQERDNLDADKPYAQYRCDLTIDNEEFLLQDNCGGIPDEYLDAAFRLGRPLIDLDGDLPTIGMYGIGMKRAIFKMAKDALVISRSEDRATSVRYGPAWLNPESDDWDLEYQELEDDGSVGVSIEIHALKDDAIAQFKGERFIEDLMEKLGQHFSYIIGRGFSINVNQKQVEPETVQIILNEAVLEPYDYINNVDGVDIQVTVGFYRNLTRQTELEEATDPEQFDPRNRSLDNAGITVICNDRVVLISDRSPITGWGVGNVPRYHPQFRAIAGLIVLSSDDAKLLPISTTKRDLDTDTQVYTDARNAAMDGIKIFTGFTNQWKGSEEQTDRFLSIDHKVEARNISLANQKGTVVRGKGGKAKKYLPELPKPKTGTKRRRIAFSRDVEEISDVGSALLGDPKAKPGDVGIAAWEEVLARLKKR